MISHLARSEEYRAQGTEHRAGSEEQGKRTFNTKDIMAVSEWI